MTDLEVGGGLGGLVPHRTPGVPKDCPREPAGRPYNIEVPHYISWGVRFLANWNGDRTFLGLGLSIE